MTGAPASFPTLSGYAFDLRSGLRDAAKQGLSELESMIGELGYGWLEGHMEDITQETSRAPFAELMKTPSRTATVKKTRTAAAAAKERTEMVRGLNARLGLSPIVTPGSPRVRQPFSPLQPRSLNIQTVPPNLVQSPTKGETAAKAAKADKPAPVKAKAKRGKGKKAAVSEDADIFEHLPIEKSPTSGGLPVTRGDREAASSAQRGGVDIPPAEVSPSKSKKSKSQSSKITASEASSSQRTLKPANEKLTEVHDVADLPPASEADVRGNLAVPERPTSIPITEGYDDDDEAEAEHLDKSAQDIIVVDDVPPKQSEVDVFATSQALSDPPTSAAVIASISGQNGTQPALPVRQVRSSWLSKALGTGTVPINASSSHPDRDILHKSMAASAQRQPPIDFSLRKSLVLPGTLKRKSEEGLDDVAETSEEMRPEKIAKVEQSVAPPIRPLFERQTSQPGAGPPADRNLLAAPISSAPVPANVGPNIGASDAQIQDDHHRSDIHKVTRALEELRERTAVKDAARQKGPLSAATGQETNNRVPQATSTGSGFLRGLGNSLGRSLGMAGSAKAAEDEAARLQREVEEDQEAERAAEEELSRLLKESASHEELLSAQHMDQVAQTASVPSTAALHAHLTLSRNAQLTPVRPPVNGRADKVDGKPEEEEVEEVEELEIEPISYVAPQRSATPPSSLLAPQTTTPTGTPPHALPAQVMEGPPLHALIEKHLRSPPTKIAKSGSIQIVSTQKVSKAVVGFRLPSPIPFNHEDDLELPDLPSPENPGAGSRKSQAISLEGETDEEEEEEEELIGGDAVMSILVSKAIDRGKADTKSRRPTSSSDIDLTQSAMVGASTTQVTMLSQATTMASKALGVKPPTGPVKSLQVAAAAAKKERVDAERKAAAKAETDRRKQEVAQAKADEERIKFEQDRKARQAELDDKKRLRIEFEKRRKEREEKVAAKAAQVRQEEEAANARAKAEEDANRKRKLAALTKSGSNNPTKKAAVMGNLGAPIVQSKEPVRSTLVPSKTIASSASANGHTKMGPTTFRTAPTGLSHPAPEATAHHITASQIQTSTITLVTQQAERRPLGPPSRPSAMQPHTQPSTLGPATSTHRASTVLQQQRVVLQSTLDEKALAMQSEDIVLPDIASEYSDSDEEKSSPDFKRPSWAESPELRAALAAQAHRNPDELFGAIKPVSMEELFKVKTNKFRARTSSANWGGGDRLTKAEEVEYARRMGFKPLASRDGSGQGSSQAP